MSSLSIEVLAESHMDVYPHKNLVIVGGEGMYVYTEADKEILDFAGGIAVNSLGHNHPKWVAALQDAVTQLVVPPSPSFPTQQKANAVERVLDATSSSEGTRDFNQASFWNCGATAMEAALKSMNLMADARGKAGKKIISFENSFHGRTLGAASITWKKQSQPEGGPYLDSAVFAKFNDLGSVRALIEQEGADNISGLVIEPVQGEGGVYPADRDFLQGLRELCDEHDITLVFDEIQVGMGRLGHMFAYQAYGVKPDMIVLAKGIGAGFPVGALLGADPKTETTYLKPGFHGSTYAGGPLPMTAVDVTIETLVQDELPQNAGKMGDYLRQALTGLSEEYETVGKPRGMGLLVGLPVELDKEGTAELSNKILENGMALPPSPPGVLRFTPPLIVEERYIDQAAEIVAKSLDDLGLE